MLASSPLNSSPTAAGSPGTFPLNNPITSNKFLTKQDREALLQYTKHFTRKAVQIIVQSRLGDKKPTKSRVYAHNTDWFNLSIKDLAQITNMTKSSLGNVEAIFNSSPFCIEISLRTPENQTMILETWCILFNDQLVDPTQKVCFSVYKKMSLVLRSLMSITRSTPTYQLSRRQNSDTYVLLYRMYCGEPIVHHLGENYATAKIGTVGTPIGSLIVNVAYRTRLTMTPQNSQNSADYCGIQIKDDHFIENRNESPGSVKLRNDSAAYSVSPSSPQFFEKSPRAPAFNEHSNLPRRSSSNLNTISETNLLKNTPKTQPIPMKLEPEVNNLQLQRYGDVHDESSADEYNSSSVGSTPDTIYYFKLKSAAFVPSASFSNNYFSSSFSNLSNENDLPPFITLLSNDFANLTTSDARNQENYTAQSPPPPNNLIEYQQQKILTNRKLKYLNNDEQMASPCSLPNFKMLEFHQNNLQESKVAVNQAPDDFVFIESKKIAFGLSNAADDLRTFFRACENAPILESFQNEPSFNDILKDLDQQLLMYESKVAEFDDLIKSFENN